MTAPDLSPTRTTPLFDRPYVGWLVLALVMFVGIVLRIAEIEASLWLDELHTAWTISGHLTDIPHRAAMGNYSPAYFWLCWVFTRLFGMTEVGLRLPSLLSGIALIPLVYVAVMRWTHSRAAGLLAAWLVAVDSVFLLFSQEARPYALIQCLALMHAMLFWSVLQTPTWRRRAILVLLGALLFYLHYTAILLVVAEVVAYGILFACWKDRPRYRPAQASLDFGLTLVACLPAASHLWAIASRRDNWKAFVAQRSIFDLLIDYPYPLVLYVYLPAGLAALAALGRKLIGWTPATRRIDGRLVVVAACWFLVPVCLAWITTRTDVARLLFPRYVIVASLVPVLAAGLACATGAQRAPRVGLATAVATAVIAADWYGYHAGPLRPYLLSGRFSSHNEDWYLSVFYMNYQADGGDQPVFVQSGLIEADDLGRGDDAALAEYCLLPVTSAIYPLDTQDRSVWPLRNKAPLATDPESLQMAIDRRGAWLVVRGDTDWSDRTVGLFIHALRERQVEAREKHRQAFGGVQLIHVEITDGDAAG